MKKLLIVGAGGHGKVVFEAANSMNEWDNIAFLDEKYPRLQKVLNKPVIGAINDAENFLSEFRYAIIAVGDVLTRMNLIKDFRKLGFILPIIIHRMACVSQFVNIKEGSVVLAGAVINANASLGEGCIVNSSSVIEHDCSLGKGVHISPNASLAGECVVGDYSWVGMGANIIQGVEIGKRAIIGAGAVVLKSVLSNSTVVGVPAKVICK